MILVVEHVAVIHVGPLRVWVVAKFHWHGMKLPAIADGGPHSPIGPGQTWSPTWTVANEHYDGPRAANNDGLKYVFYAQNDAAYSDLL